MIFPVLPRRPPPRLLVIVPVVEPVRVVDDAADIIVSVGMAGADVKATSTPTQTRAQTTWEASRHQYLVWAIMMSFPIKRVREDEWSFGSSFCCCCPMKLWGRFRHGLLELVPRGDLPAPLMLIPTLLDAMVPAYMKCTVLGARIRHLVRLCSTAPARERESGGDTFRPSWLLMC